MVLRRVGRETGDKIFLRAFILEKTIVIIIYCLQYKTLVYPGSERGLCERRKMI